MVWNLSGGSVEQIMAGEQIDQPVLQVLAHKKIAGSGGSVPDRYRLLLSDGIHTHSSVMLATQLNEKITSGELDTNSVIRLNKYSCNKIQDRRVTILLEIDILAHGNEVGDRLGNPVALKASGSTAQSNSASATAPGAAADGPRPLTNNTSGNISATSGGGSFYGKKNTGGPQQSKPYSAQNVPKTPGGTPAKVHPISSLTPYQNRWTVRARVTSKSSIRTWSNSRGEGKLFSMNLLDESGEIKATAFRDEVDKFYDIIEVNKVYYLTKASLKTADKRYSSLNNDYEMTFNSDTQVTPCTDDSDLPNVSFNFVQINQLDQHQANAIIDLIGVVKGVNELNTIMTKTTNREVKKRDIQLVDQGKVQVRMTLWGNDAETFNRTDNPILAVKGAKLSDFGGRSLSALSSSQILLNPDIPEAHQLRGWYDSVGHSLDYDEFRNEGGPSSGGYSTNWKSFAEVKNQNISGDKPEYFTTKGTIVFMKKENCMYTACPSENCNKKVVDQGNGMYRCEKCQKEYPNFKWRLILSSNLADYSDNQWVTCFQETAESILGKSAEELGSLREAEAEFDQVFEEATFKSYIFKCRAKMETYNDESRLKTVCVSATPLNFKEYSKQLIDDIEKLAVL